MAIPLSHNALMGLTAGKDLPESDQEWVKASLGVLRQRMLEDEATITLLREALKLAVDTIELLAEQQAMSDEWYKKPLEKIRELSV